MDPELYKAFREREPKFQVGCRHWELIQWEAVKALGEKDAASWLEDNRDLFEHENFIKTPQNKHTIKSLYKKEPQWEHKTWECPHPYPCNKLGYYLIWSNGECKEVFGGKQVRQELSV